MSSPNISDSDIENENKKIDYKSKNKKNSNYETKLIKNTINNNNSPKVEDLNKSKNYLNNIKEENERIKQELIIIQKKLTEKMKEIENIKNLNDQEIDKLKKDK